MSDTTATANYVKESKPFFRPIFLLIPVLLIGGITAYRLNQSSSSDIPTPTEISTPEIKTVTALGRLEPSGEIIEVSASSLVQNDKIEQLLVKEGDQVVQGQTIAVLASHDRLKAALIQATEKVRIAEAKLTQIKAGAKQGEIKAQEATIQRLQAELRGAKATNTAKLSRLEAQLQGEKVEKRAAIERIEADLGNAEREFQRYKVLADEGAISESDLDLRRTTMNRTRQQLAEAKASFSKTVETLSEEIRETKFQTNETIDTLNQQIEAAKADLDRIAEVRPVDVQVAVAELKEAEAAVAKAQAELDLTYIKSPQAGQILDILTRPGELVSSDGIVKIGQTNQMYAVAEVYESDIGKIKIGQKATITSHALTEDLQGTVERIGLEVQRQEVVNTDPAANIDAKVIEVRVQLDEPSSQKVAGLTNLLVTVTMVSDTP